MNVTFVGIVTAMGVPCDAAADALPNAPLVPDPQQYADPLDFSAHAWSRPTDILIYGEPPTGTGKYLGEVWPLPSLPP